MPDSRKYRWQAEGQHHELNFVWVPGTNGQPYMFGREPRSKWIYVDGFFIASTPLTQALWAHAEGEYAARGGPAWRDNLRLQRKQ